MSTPDARTAEQRVERVREDLAAYQRKPYSDNYAHNLALHVPFLLSQLDAQAARVRELEQDKERLDWLEEGGHTAYRSTLSDVAWVTDVRDEGKSVDRIIAPTLRAAIDAARTQEGTP